MRALPALFVVALAALVTVPAGAGAPPTDASRAGEVRYWRAERVATAFAKGAVLDAEPGANYMIHTSRRTAPGMAEVHADDTDLIHVLEGSAVFVTGGKVLEPRETAPGEVRGRAIEGGETRVLSPGDVIVVPRGTPHWFREVRGPVLYYTVKVR